MKYIPLFWAALRRKPARLVLTLLSVVVAFALFGMMVGFRASFSHIVDIARADRIYVNSRFAGGLPYAMVDQVARIPGVTHLANEGFVGGYYQNPRNNIAVLMIDGKMHQVWPELPLSAAQFAQLAATRNGVFISRAVARRLRVTLHPGDTLPVKAPGLRRADGNQTWAFTILGLADDIETQPEGFAVGNIDFLNEARIAADRNTGGFFRVLVADPARGDAIAKLIDQSFANSGTPTRSISEKTAYENGTSSGNGIDFPFVMESIAAAGLFMILFLTGNSIAQSVRERIPEFAVLKTMGFSDAGVMALVFAEAAMPCLIGAAIGMALATWVGSIFPRLLPPGASFPPPYMSSLVYVIALLAAILVALVSAVIPATRIARLDVATALSGR
jgi:putative ABC transport system permease protein